MKVTGIQFQLTNNLQPRVDPQPVPVAKGAFDVEGEVTCHFQAPDEFFRRFEEGQRRYENWLLRVVRPHMPKRMFQRMRGQLRATRRTR